MESPHWEVTVVEGGATVNGVPIEMTVPNVYSSLFAHLAGVARLVGHPVLARGIDHTQGDAESWFTVDARGNAEAADPPSATRPAARNRARLSRSDQERGRGSSTSSSSGSSNSSSSPLRLGSVAPRSLSGSGGGTAATQGPTIARRSALSRNEAPSAGRHGAPAPSADSAATALLTPLEGERVSSGKTPAVPRRSRSHARPGGASSPAAESGTEGRAADETSVTSHPARHPRQTHAGAVANLAPPSASARAVPLPAPEGSTAGRPSSAPAPSSVGGTSPSSIEREVPSNPEPAFDEAAPHNDYLDLSAYNDPQGYSQPQVHSFVIPESGSIEDSYSSQPESTYSAQDDFNEHGVYSPGIHHDLVHPAEGIAHPHAESIPPSSLFVRPPKAVPRLGMRAAVYQLTAGRFNLGPSQGEIRAVEREARISRPLYRPYSTAFLSFKGGIGKTSTTVGVGLTMAALRGASPLAIDANPDSGDLAERLFGEVELVRMNLRTISDFVREIDESWTLTDMSDYFVEFDRFHVVPGDQDPEVSDSLTAEGYLRVHDMLSRFFPVILVDCGTGVTHNAMKGILSRVDNVVVAAGYAVSGAKRAVSTLEWLSSHGYGNLAKESVVVLTDKDGVSSRVHKDAVRSQLESRSRAVFVVPNDPAVADGDRIDLARVSQRTKDAWADVAAAVVDGYR